MPTTDNLRLSIAVTNFDADNRKVKFDIAGFLTPHRSLAVDVIIRNGVYRKKGECQIVGSRGGQMHLYGLALAPVFMR